LTGRRTVSGQVLISCPDKESLCRLRWLARFYETPGRPGEEAVMADRLRGIGAAMAPTK